jgi:hypothetical protein
MKKVLALILLAAISFNAMAVDKTVRSSKTRTDFVKSIACPGSGLNKLPCVGYIMDHIQPLDCGGADTPENLQWLTVEAWRAKSKWERSNALCEFQTKGQPPTGVIPWWTRSAK